VEHSGAWFDIDDGSSRKLGVEALDTRSSSSRTTSKDHPLVTGENAAAELFLICSSGKAANVPKPASVGIASSQIRIAFGVRMFDEMRNFCLLQKFLPVGSSFFLRTA
jgi:hypothetical protein